KGATNHAFTRLHTTCVTSRVDLLSVRSRGIFKAPEVLRYPLDERFGRLSLRTRRCINGGFEAIFRKQEREPCLFLKLLQRIRLLTRPENEVSPRDRIEFVISHAASFSGSASFISPACLACFRAIASWMSGRMNSRR